jgi:hypothetical protein
VYVHQWKSYFVYVQIQKLVSINVHMQKNFHICAFMKATFHKVVHLWKWSNFLYAHIWKPTSVNAHI